MVIVAASPPASSSDEKGSGFFEGRFARVSEDDDTIVFKVSD